MLDGAPPRVTLCGGCDPPAGDLWQLKNEATADLRLGGEDHAGIATTTRRIHDYISSNYDYTVLNYDYAAQIGVPHSRRRTSSDEVLARQEVMDDPAGLRAGAAANYDYNVPLKWFQKHTAVIP